MGRKEIWASGPGDHYAALTPLWPVHGIGCLLSLLLQAWPVKFGFRPLEWVHWERIGKNRSLTIKRFLPLPYGEKRGKKRNCFFQREKYFFTPVPKSEKGQPHPKNCPLATRQGFPLYHMEKRGDENGTVFFDRRNIFVGRQTGERMERETDAFR